MRFWCAGLVALFLMFISTKSSPAQGCFWGMVDRVYPVHESINVPLKTTLRIERTLPPITACDHVTTIWQVAKAPVFRESTIVFDSGVDAENLTFIALADDVLEKEFSYYWRVQLADADGNTSAWTLNSKFTTGTNVDAPPPDPSGADINAAIARLVPNHPAGEDSDQRIGDKEILEAIRIWVVGAPIPTLGKSIGDEKIVELIRLWITDAQI